MMIQIYFGDLYKEIFRCSNCNDFINNKCKGKGYKYEGVMKCLEKKADGIKYLVSDDYFNM